MRFIDLGIVSPQYSVVADRAIFDMHSKGSLEDTLYIYRRDQPSVSLGRFRTESTDVNREKTLQDGVDIVRRISGGSSIYSDAGQLTYAVVIKRSSIPADRTESFEYICRGLIASLNILGIEGEYKPVNDILVGNRKISGSAQHRDPHTVLQHGSIIIETPQARIDSYLRQTKARSYDGTISMREILGCVPQHEEIVSSLKMGFSSIFGDIPAGKLSAEELGRIDEEMDKPINRDDVAVKYEPCLPRA